MDSHENMARIYLPITHRQIEAYLPITLFETGHVTFNEEKYIISVLSVHIMIYENDEIIVILNIPRK